MAQDTGELEDQGRQTPDYDSSTAGKEVPTHGDEPESADVLPVDKAVDRQALKAARELFDRGHIALAAKRYGEAIAQFKAAAAGVPGRYAGPLGDCLDGLAEAFYRHGCERGDNSALRQSIEVWRSALQYRPRDRLPLEWAMTQSDLGATLTTLGERESNTAPLREAVAAFRAALEERTRDRAPRDWAVTQHHLGIALGRLGRLENGTTHLIQAVAAFRAALDELPRARAPLEWAGAQYNLGNVLIRLGERSPGAAHFREAVAAYQAALEERTRERVPLDWAMTVGNEGIALMLLAERSGDAARARAAIQQIEIAYGMMQSHGGADLAVNYSRQLSRAQILLRRLTMRNTPNPR